MKYKIKKNTVQETLMIPLYGRKMCSELYPKLYRDETAIRLMDEVDYDFNTIKHTLAEEIAADPAKVDAALDLLMVIKYLERIGDHAVNVAEWVQFVRTGRYKDESMF